MEIEKLYQLFLNSLGVVTDTRIDLKSKIFFALKGENFNGNKYSSQALDGGSLFSVIDEEIYQESEKHILVPNVLKTLQQLASFHRKQLSLPILAITGTNGKTTNKELLGNVLSRKFKCYFTKGNLNNHIGVPLSLLEMSKTDEFAVIEMGANRMGDITELCEIVDPDYGYITNIGIAHLEGFKTKENILLEKGRLFEHIQSKKGVFFVNTEEKEVYNLAKNYNHSVFIGKREQDDFIFKLERSIPTIAFSGSSGDKYVSSLYGIHNYENLKMVCGICQYFKVPNADIKLAFKAYIPQNNRSQYIEKDGISLIMDAYNANPSSMKSSILSFAKFDSNQKILILGDMLEMGEQSSFYHQDILKLISRYNWKEVILIGEKFSEYANVNTGFKFYPDVVSADQYVNTLFEKGNYFLLKGSRGQALEKLEIIQKLK